MSTRNDFLEAVSAIDAFIDRHDDYLVTAHVRPDGDAWAAICAWCRILALRGKAFEAWVDGAPDERYRFLEGFHRIRNVRGEAPPVNRVFGAAVVLDTPTVERLGETARLLPESSAILKIDHHRSNEPFGGIELVRPEMSSTCEITFRLLDGLNIKPDAAMATALYAGICFDTGRFRFSNTRPGTFSAAAALVRRGADPEAVSDRIFYRWSPLRARTMGRVLQEMSFYEGGRVAVSMLPYNFFRDHPAGHQVIEGFSDLGVSIAGVVVSLFFKEIKPEVFKVSLRAAGDYDVAAVAHRFRGGGHTKAAGCVVEGNFNVTRDAVLAAVSEMLEAVDATRRQPHSE